jgi:hypothetical protein
MKLVVFGYIVEFLAYIDDWWVRDVTDTENLACLLLRP